MKKIFRLLWPALLALGRPAVIGILHEAFRKHPQLKSIVTESLLSYEDTNAE